MEKCSWLKDERYSKWLSADHVNKHAAFCRVCERVFLLTTMGIKAVDSHMKSEKHKTVVDTANGGKAPIVSVCCNTNTLAQWLGVGLVGHSVVKTVF